MGKLKDLAEKCCTQETFVIENPGPNFSHLSMICENVRIK